MFCEKPERSDRPGFEGYANKGFGGVGEPAAAQKALSNIEDIRLITQLEKHTNKKTTTEAFLNSD